MGDFKQPVLNKSKLDELYSIISSIKSTVEKHGTSSISEKAAIDMKHALNKYYLSDYICDKVYLSDNDKDFFGIYIRRLIPTSICFVKDMRDLNERDINHYMIDFDLKLFTLDLTADEILSLLLYDTYKILSNEASVDLISAIDAICASRNETYKSSSMNVVIEQIFDLCCADYIYRKFSIFAHNENELIRIPDLLVAYDLSSEFENAANIIYKVSNAVGKATINPALPLNWVFSIMLNYTPRSMDTFNVLNDYMMITGSEMIKKLIFRINSNAAKAASDITKKIIGEASLFSSIRKSGMKSLENDLFEYEMRVKNIYDEDSAIFLMRQINSRMSIIQDYLEEERLSENEMKRWQILYDRYDRLRIKMTSKNIYSKKMYGLFTDYNALMQPGYENLMTMNTVY